MTNVVLVIMAIDGLRIQRQLIDIRRQLTQRPRPARAGICGHALPPTTDGPITWCTLSAGHDGWHHDQVTGADWTDAAGEPSWQDQP